MVYVLSTWKTFTLSFRSPQPWITDALYTARNLRKLTIEVKDTDPSFFIRIFENLPSWPQLHSLAILAEEEVVERENGAYEILYWIAKKCPLLDRLRLARFVIDAEMASLIKVPSLDLDYCMWICTPPATIRHLRVTDDRILRFPMLPTTRLVHSQLPVL